MILSDKYILKLLKIKKLGISPFNYSFLNPSSYDVSLNNTFLIYKNNIYDTHKSFKTKKIIIKNSIMICPPFYQLSKSKIKFLKEKYNVDYVINRGILGSTNEYIKLPKNISAQYQGRSSLGRLFLTSHQTAGWIDAGFEGRITLEFIALDRPVILYKNQRIGQLIFHKLSSNCNISYKEKLSSKYMYQKLPTSSKIYKDL